MGDWPRPGLQPDLGRWSASPAPSLRAPAEGARGGRTYPAVPKPPGPLGQGERVARAFLVTAPLRAALATLLGRSSSARHHATTGDGRLAGEVTAAAGRRCPEQARLG